MTKTILITGATDGLGRATALSLAAKGHALLVHGRNASKLAATADELKAVEGAGRVVTFQADLSDLNEVARLGRDLVEAESRIDVVVNNAGVLKVANPRTAAGLDVRFVVNTLAPALLTRALLPVVPKHGRFVHLSSAAQAPVDLGALQGKVQLSEMEAYSQSKLALTMWSQALAAELGPDGPISVAVNPGSLLATNMVRDGFGMAGNDLNIGVDILTRASLHASFAHSSGKYFDNDSGRFAAPHRAASNKAAVSAVVDAIESLIGEHR